MDDTNDMIETPPVVPQNAGARLRAARESLGLTVEQVAAQWLQIAKAAIEPR